MVRHLTLGLGSNVGDRFAYLYAAATLLERAFVVEGRSGVYETPPLGPPQPDYLNAAMRVATELGLEQVLDVLLATERRLGRERGERWGPRTIDLDLLYADGETYSSERLVVPHPGLMDRVFALAPLADVTPAPEAMLRLVELGGPPAQVGWLSDVPEGDTAKAVEALLARATGT